jgi:hypothetical protein
MMLAWVPAFAGMTLEMAKGSILRSSVPPEKRNELQAGSWGDRFVDK